MGRHAHYLPNQGGRVGFYSRNRNNVTACFPELVPALTELTDTRDLILDGEIIAADPATGAPSFARLQQRMHLQRPSVELRRALPVQLFVFDSSPRTGRHRQQAFRLHVPAWYPVPAVAEDSTAAKCRRVTTSVRARS
ncbi:hypothetical protein AB0H49_26345 [Nocardia sp. NPDC050713]|uniref:ATP-dependent DNA ligase n=1 Tax=Nocardia sp. NPDC050713 TaxID=3154511 RepID=UPI0033E9AD92